VKTLIIFLIVFGFVMFTREQNIRMTIKKSQIRLWALMQRLFASRIIWYRPNSGDNRRLGR